MPARRTPAPDPQAVVVAVCMWIALFAAVRRFHRHGEPWCGVECHSRAKRSEGSSRSSWSKGRSPTRPSRSGTARREGRSSPSTSCPRRSGRSGPGSPW